MRNRNLSREEMEGLLDCYQEFSKEVRDIFDISKINGVQAKTKLKTMCTIYNQQLEKLALNLCFVIFGKDVKELDIDGLEKKVIEEIANTSD